MSNIHSGVLTLTTISGIFISRKLLSEPLDFIGQDLREADFRGLYLEGADFSNALLQGADFTRSDLYWARFYDSLCERACFIEATFRGSEISGGNFADANFKKARFLRDNLNIKCDLNGANLSNAILAEVELEGAQYDAATMFPENFRPEIEGLTIKPESR